MNDGEGYPDGVMTEEECTHELLSWWHALSPIAKLLQWTRLTEDERDIISTKENHMERTITHRGRTFTIRADQTDEGFTESVFEHMSNESTAHWDGSGMVYPTAEDCLNETEASVIETIDDDAL